jgi:chemotaxis protein methyltransferase CheR
MESLSFDQISHLICQESGLCFAGRRKSALRSLLKERVVRLGLPDIATYRELFRNSAGEQAELYDLITVNETSFFRNPLQFDDLKTRIIPAIEEEKGRLLMRSWGDPESSSSKDFRKLRILSAGCSTGEEPYSIAMTLLDSLRYPLAWDLEILAGDLSDSCLLRAAEGRYEESRLKGIPSACRDRYLRMDTGGGTVRDEVKGQVRFEKLNLARIIAGESFPGVPRDFPGFDIIFCRNVMIYFPTSSQQLLVDALQRALVPGGYLFTGDAEPLHLYRHDLETVRNAGSLIYRKKSSGAMPELAALPSATGVELSTACGIEELLFLVSNTASGVRPEALKRLRALGIDAVYPIAESAVANDADAELRNAAMELLVSFGEAAVPRLITLLTEGNDEVRNFSTVMLGSIGSRTAVPSLIAALKDPDVNVRHGAAEALGLIGDSRALEPLMELLDQGFWMQCPAISALGSIGSAQALPRLLELLCEEFLFEPVTQALEKIGDSRAIPPLRAVMSSPDSNRAGRAALAVSMLEKKSGVEFRGGDGR